MKARKGIDEGFIKSVAVWMLELAAWLMVGLEPGDALAQCTPNPSSTSAITAEDTSDWSANDVDWNDGHWVPDDSTADQGHGLTAWTSEDTTEAGAVVYVWAEDGENSEVQFISYVTRQHNFKTTCSVALPCAQPFGWSQHLVEAEAHIIYTAGASGGNAQRSASVAMTAVMPTGRTLNIEWELTDTAAATNEKTVQWTVNAQGGLSAGVAVEGSASGVVGGAVNVQQEAGLSGSINVLHKTKWTSSATSSGACNEMVVDREVFETYCHGVEEHKNEHSGIAGSFNLTNAPTNVSYIKGYFEVDQDTNVQEFPIKQCGGTAIRDPIDAFGIGTPGSTTTPPGGPPGGGPGGRGDGIRKIGSSMNDTGKGYASAEAHFLVTIYEGSGAEELHFAIPSGSQAFIDFAGSGVARFIEAGTMGSDVPFDPEDPLELDSGVWLVVVELEVLAPGAAEVQMSFDSLMPSANTTSSHVELVQDAVTVSEWPYGVHSGMTGAASPVIDRAGEASITLDVILGSAAPSTLSVVGYTVVSGVDSWAAAPAIAYDAEGDRYFIHMAPSGAVEVEVTVSLAGESIVVPVSFDYGVDDL